MSSRDFVYWLNGFLEIANPSEITYEQTLMIKKHLALVFKHEIDPSMGPKPHQDELNAIHNGGKPEKPPRPEIVPDYLQSKPGETLLRC